MALLGLCGCYSTPTLNYTVAIDRSFSDDQVDSIQAALSDWVAALPNLRVEPTLASCTPSDEPRHVCVAPAFDAPDPSHDVVGNTSLGDMGDLRVLIYVNRIDAISANASSLTRQTMAHEMGHVLGLQHTSPGELMAPDVPDQAPTVTPADVAQFWSLHGG